MGPSAIQLILVGLIALILFKGRELLPCWAGWAKGLPACAAN